MAAEFFAEIQIPHQKSYSAVPFPSVLSPPAAAARPSSAALLARSVKAQRPHLDSLLHRSGALLLRGFGVTTAEDFNEVVEAFGFEELPYVGGAAPRTNVVGRVFTANESPPDQKIPFHHEMAQVPEFPSKLFFFCEVEPGTGGETPIVLSHIVYERMNQRYPEFVRQLEEHGLIYTRVLGEADDPSSPIGRGWKSTFLTDDKSIAEKRAAHLGMKLEWTEDGVKSIMGPIPAIKFDSSRNRKIWFNSMVAAYTGWKDSRNDPVKAVTFGNGDPLPSDVIYDCLRILEEECAAIPWRKGDVLLIDNLAVLHSRRSFTPPRRVPEFPSKLFFFCEVEPGSGGETPIVLSHIVYERINERYPDFVRRLEEHGLIYTRVLSEDDDPSSPIGRGWKSTFLTNDKIIAEKRASHLGVKLEWTEDGVKTVMGPIPAIKFDNSRNQKIWFNNMVAAYIGWKDSRNNPVKAVTFGNGDPLPSYVINMIV